MKRLVAFLLLIAPIIALAQNYQDRWTGHFAYVSIKDISQGDNKIFVAAENAVFTYDLSTQKITTLSTIDGLSGEFITAIHYSEEFRLLIIGYENGLMNIVKEGEANVLKVVDIREKQTIPPDRRRINNFDEHDGNLYISTKYGISMYNLARLEFGDTYFIGDGGNQINVVQTSIQEPYIFAASEANGMRRALVADNNLIDYQNWTTIMGGGYKALETLGDELYAATNANKVIRFTSSGNPTTVQNFSNDILTFRSNNELLTITTGNSLQVYSPGFISETEIRNVQGFNLKLNTGYAFGTNAYLGTDEDGLLIVPFESNQATQIKPNGPIRNGSFAMDATAGQLWLSFGETDVNFNPYYPNGQLSRYGVSHLKDSVWSNISYNELSSAVNGEPTDLIKVTINPTNTKEVYMSSFQKGLLKIVDEEPVILYDETNSPLERVRVGTADYGLRINGSQFDQEGNLWFVQSKTDKGLIRLSPGGQFQKIDLSNYMNPLSELALTKLVISRENYVFFGSYYNGVFGYNPTTGAINKIGENQGRGNLPSANVRALAIDAQNRLWIGTLLGLRVVYSPSSFFQEGSQAESQPIIILEDGVAQELLYQQSITDIEVDGSNNKWISTATSGVFYLSADGQKTILRFTKDNSPLPTNNVQDIAIDPFTGVVYFATTQGLVAYKGTATAPRDNLEKVHAFPNPVRPGFSGDVTIDGLTAQANVKITDITGNLVFEEVSRGGSVLWDTTAFGKYKVRSGVYLVLVTTDDFTETKVAKIMIIR